jgi:hypothetical protein
MAGEGPRKIVFVGGAPRSGTTVTHALLCTSTQVCNYHPEISFFRGIPQSYRNGRAAWAHHTQAFFSDHEAFRLMMRQTADVPIGHLWRALGEAPILCMKDPLLTPFFHDLRSLYPSEAWFVVVVRHPDEVVRSRQEVHERSGLARPFGPQDAAAVAREYLATYQAILAQGFSGRLFMFRYEDLNTDRIREGLAGFLGVDDLNPDLMWGTTKPAEDDPWGSPKYNKPIDLDPRLSPLAPELAAVARAICGPIMQRFGYAHRA